MKKQQIRILCAILALSLLCPCIGAAAMDAEAFDDWEPGAWYVSAMAWCVQEGYFEGTEQNTIEAGRSITRAEFLAVMVRYFRCTEPADISYFSDVSPEDWFYDAVSKDYMADITNGVSETLFAPYRNITREEAFTMFVRALNPDGPAPASLSGYEDAEQISAWARDSVAGIVALGVIEGYEDHTLRPKAEITRAEVAQMLYRASLR